jgi:hypothetical protein
MPRGGEGEDSIQYFHRWARRQYLTKREQERRARAKAEGARRFDVTLSDKALEDYATVRFWLEDLNRIAVERNIPMPPIRLSDTEIITAALRRAASAILEDDKA